MRAGIVERPEVYRWSSLGYHTQAGNKESFLLLDFGLGDSSRKSKKDRLAMYRQYVYEKGSIDSGRGEGY